MISIIIPCFNEGNTILETLNECSLLLQKQFAEIEIIVINDGSFDNTQYVLIEAKNMLPLDIKVVSNVHNLGYGASLKKGIELAKHDTLLIVDADGTYPLHYIKDLYLQFLKGYDLVIGDRSKNFKDYSIFKKGFRFLLLQLVHFTTGNKVPDVNSGLRIFSKSAVIPYLSYLSNGFSFTTSQTIIFLLEKKFVAYFPIEYQNRKGSSKVKIVRDSLRTLQFITELIARFNPVKFFLLLAIPLWLMGITFFCLWFIPGNQQYLFTSTCFLLGGYIIFSFGFLAICLRR